MKALVSMAKNSINSSEGFLNGFFKGAIGCAATIVIFVFLTGYVG